MSVDSRKNSEPWKVDDAITAARLESMRDLAERAQLSSTTKNVRLYTGAQGGTAVAVDDTPQQQDRSRLLLLRNNMDALNPAHAMFDPFPDFGTGTAGQWYEALIVPQGASYLDYFADGPGKPQYNFKRGVIPPDCIAFDPNQMQTTDAPDVYYAGGRKPRPLRGSYQLGIVLGTVTPSPSTEVAFPLVVISPGMKRWRWNGYTRNIEVSFVLHPEADIDNPDELWVPEYTVGPCIPGT